MEESWKAIEGYEGLYEVSSLGRVKSIITKPIILKPSPGRSGYPEVFLYKNREKKCIRVHRLVAKAFVKNPFNKPFVNHLDETKTNNAAYNLDWVTHIENCNWGTAIARRESKIDHKAINARTDPTNHVRASSKPIAQYKEGKLIKEWSSGAECSRETGFPRSTISHIATGRTQTPVSGYIFKFVEKGEQQWE